MKDDRENPDGTVMAGECAGGLFFSPWMARILEGLDGALFCVDEEGYAEKVCGTLSGAVDQAGKRMLLDMVADQDRDAARAILVEARAGLSRGVVVLRTDRGGALTVTMVAARAAEDGTIVACMVIPCLSRLGNDMDQWFTKLSVAVEQSPASVVITDVEGTIEYVNPKFTRLTGYTYNEAIGRNPRILKSGLQPDGFYRDLWETITAGKEWRGEFHNIKKNGESYWEQSSISPIRNRDGAITHFLGVKEDITERKKAEEALRLSEEKLRARNLEMEKDLQLAQFAVMRLLPEGLPSVPGLEIGYRYIPMDSIGGDFISFNSLPENRLGVFIGDIVGHGVSAALYLSMLKSVTDRLNRKFPLQPDLYMERLDREFRTVNDTFVLTGLYGLFEPGGEGMAFSFTRAGHPHPVLLRRGGRAEALISRGRPIGIDREEGFACQRIILRRGDRIFLYTDGLTEMPVGNEDILDLEGLMEIVDSVGVPGAEVAVDRVLAAASAMRGGRPADDDIVLVGFEVL